jgi:hypothetical protein
MAGAGVVIGLLLPIAVAAPASAATLFVGSTTNGAASALMYYQYDQCNSAGYCHISVSAAQVEDSAFPPWAGDGWGGILYMHYTTRTGTYRENLGVAPDEGWKFVDDFERTGYKDVWFQVCNYNESTGERYSCARLRKF